MFILFLSLMILTFVLPVTNQLNFFFQLLLKLHYHHHILLSPTLGREEKVDEGTSDKTHIGSLTFKLTAQFVMEYMTRCLRVLHNFRESSRMLLVISRLLPSSLSPLLKFFSI